MNGELITPEQFLHSPGLTDVIIFRESLHGALVPVLRVAAPWRTPGSSWPFFDDYVLHEYYFGLADAAERAFVKRIADRGVLELRWVNEGVTAEHDLSAYAEWLVEAAEAAEQIDAPTWREIVAQAKWEYSEAGIPGRKRPKRHRRHRATTTATTPCFAELSGALPRNGRPSVAGLRLPQGERADGYWYALGHHDDAAALARQLSTRFPDTGLWPLIWTFPDDPASYATGTQSLAAIDEVDAVTVLESRWSALPDSFRGTLGATLPSLPAAQTVDTPLRNPFDQLAAHWEQTDQPSHTRLILVSCNRPADIPTSVGLPAAEEKVVEVSAVLRYWEDRLGVFVAAADPSQLTLAACSHRNVRTESAQEVAAHLTALAPHYDASETGAIDRLSRAVEGAEGPTVLRNLGTSAAAWTIGWHD
jgi:hypothetical protein